MKSLRKNVSGTFIVSLFMLSFISCVRDEALNTEADITSISVEGVETIGKPQINNDEITFFVNAWDDVTHLAPVFTITEGATVEPASGTVRDFTTPQTYTLTSQDGVWKKTYKVSFISDDIATKYSFENMKLHEEAGGFFLPKVEYHVFYDMDTEGSEMEWGSGNAGAKLTLSGKAAGAYPTSQSEDGYIGKCVKLQTISTGSLGALVQMPIAAGNLFIGNFDSSKALSSPLKATQFGRPFRKVPERLIGYYKYKAGDKFTNASGATEPGKKDDFAIYAVLFDTSNGNDYLDGSNSLTSDAIVLKAELQDRKETNEWIKFSIPFEYVNGRVIDTDKLATGKYKLAIVLSSSKDGASFEGAIGSTLYVDEMELFSE